MTQAELDALKALTAAVQSLVIVPQAYNAAAKFALSVAVPALVADVERLTAQVAELKRDLAETRQELAMWEADPEGMKDY